MSSDLAGAGLCIDGNTGLIAHIGYPTHTFKSPLIYNPYFAQADINAVVVPMACTAESYPGFLRSLFQLRNLLGALITMPHKVSTVALLDLCSPRVLMAGACNAVRTAPDGRLEGDLFDGEGFVRAIRRKGRVIQGQRALIVGCGGVGSAIAASLAVAGIGELTLDDTNRMARDALVMRLRRHAPEVTLRVGERDPSGMDLVINATPLGMQAHDASPLDTARLTPGMLVGEVVLSDAPTPLLRAAMGLGCEVIHGLDMLFEQIPAYLEFFGLPVTTADHLRSLMLAPRNP